jgi:hypothetical protein
MTRLPYTPQPTGAMCACCDEAKTEGGVLVAIERGEAMIYRFVCGGCIVSLVETYAKAIDTPNEVPGPNRVPR